jgi:general secretion pathway protein C
LRGARVRALGPRIAEWVLIALIAFLLAQALIAFFAPLPVPAGDRIAALPAAKSQSGTVEGRNPFPAAVIDAAPVEAGPELAETALDLKLVGTWVDDERSSAIIQKPDGKQEAFELGQEIIPGVRLVAVYADQVVIEQNGVRESLRFESKITAPRPIQNTAQGSEQNVPDADDSGKITNAPSGNGLGRAFRLAPGVDPAGRPAILLYAGRDRSTFEASGLRDGDVLRSVNGSPPPSSPNELAAMMSQFMKAGAATIVVERDGAMETIELSQDGSGDQ